MSDADGSTTQPPARLLLREAIGREAHDERVRRGERLVDVARHAALSPQYLSEIERGRKDPSSEVLRELAQALELDPLELVRRAAERMSDGRDVERERVLVAAGGRVEPSQAVRVRFAAGFGAPSRVVVEDVRAVIRHEPETGRVLDLSPASTTVDPVRTGASLGTTALRADALLLAA